MLKKNFLSILMLLVGAMMAQAQHTKWGIALQTTTIEAPPPFANFRDYGKVGNTFGTVVQKDYSLEGMGRFFLKDNIALRLRMGVTHYKLNRVFLDLNSFLHTQLSGKLEKYAIGIETSHPFGKNLGFRFGCDFQWGTFKNMIDIEENDFGRIETTFDKNHVKSLIPFFAGDWLIIKGLALGVEFRMPFEQANLLEAGKTISTNNPLFVFNHKVSNYAGFGTPVSCIQLSYRF